MDRSNVFKFPPKPKPHEFWHLPFVATLEESQGYSFHHCSRCGSWRISRLVSGRRLYTKKWLDEKTYEEICSGVRSEEIRPKMVWLALKIADWIDERVKNG